MTIWEILNHDFNLLQCCFYISSFFTLIFNQISNWYFFLFYRHFVFFEHPPLVFMFSTKCLIFGFVSHKVTMLLDALLLRYLGDIRTHSPVPWCGWVFLLRLYWIQLLCVCNIRICLLTPFISVPLKLITRSHLSALFALIHSFHSQWESENCDLLSIFNVLSIHPFASAFHFQVLFNLLITLLNLLVLQESSFALPSVLLHRLLCCFWNSMLSLQDRGHFLRECVWLPDSQSVTSLRSAADSVPAQISTPCLRWVLLYRVKCYCWRHTGEILGARRGQRSPSMRYLPITQL